MLKFTRSTPYDPTSKFALELWEYITAKYSDGVGFTAAYWTGTPTVLMRAENEPWFTGKAVHELCDFFKLNYKIWLVVPGDDLNSIYVEILGSVPQSLQSVLRDYLHRNGYEEVAV